MRSVEEIKELLKQSEELHELYVSGAAIDFPKFEMNVERLCVLKWVLGDTDNLLQRFVVLLP